MLLALQFLATVLAPDAMAPAVAGSVYLPLMALHALHLPVLASAESGGWGAPSPLGWIALAVFWASIWWAVASFVSRLWVKRRPARG